VPPGVRGSAIRMHVTSKGREPGWEQVRTVGAEKGRVRTGPNDHKCAARSRSRKKKERKAAGRIGLWTKRRTGRCRGSVETRTRGSCYQNTRIRCLERNMKKVRENQRKRRQSAGGERIRVLMWVSKWARTPGAGSHMDGKGEKNRAVVSRGTNTSRW